MLSIAQELIQHYVLDVEPRATESVIAQVERSAKEAAEWLHGIGPWSYYAWLERPAIWAIRPIRITSGLDVFLIENGGLPGVVDVGELMTHGLVDTDVPGHLSNSWNDFVRDAPKGGPFFSSFLWLNWETLLDPATWKKSVPPLKSDILAACRRVFGERAAVVASRLQKPIRLLLTSTPGDCDLVLYGITQNTTDVDECLFLINQLTCDTLAPYLAEATLHASTPLVLRSRTELAVEYELYQRVRASRGQDRDLIENINETAGRNLIPEVALNRGGGAITAVHNGITEIIGPQWLDQPVFGRDDFVVRLASPDLRCGMGDFLALLARLDEATIQDASFPCRSSLRLGFHTPVGRAQPQTVASWPPASTITIASPRLDNAVLDALTTFIRSLSALQWREDLRIIERLAERCVTLQKSHGLPRETRQMLATAFRRFGDICQRIQGLERKLEESAPMIEAGLDENSRRAYVAARDEIQLLRCELYYAGASLDRVLTHHSRGVVSLLLHPSSQARGPTHFVSEIALSSGLGIFFRAPVTRLNDRIVRGQYPARSAEWCQTLSASLQRISKPIIYASHEPDFEIRPGLTLLRIPTWALWLPTTHILHEFGHALAIVGPLHYLARKVLSRIGGGPICPCLAFEEKIARLGLEIHQPGEWAESTSLAEFARDHYFSDLRPASGGLAIPDLYQRQILEEIAADTVERLLGYESRESGDRMHLLNCLPSIVPYALKAELRKLRDRIFRLFASQLVVKLAFAARNGELRLLAPSDAPRVREIAHAHAGIFSEWLSEWLADFLGNGAAKALPWVGRQMIRELLQSSARDLKNDLSGLLGFSHLLAVVLSLGPVSETTFQSLFKSSLVWGNLLDLAEDADNQGATIQGLATIIAAGQVPSERYHCPERLVGVVTEQFRDPVRATVPPHVRVALSHYFSSLCWP